MKGINMNNKEIKRNPQAVIVFGMHRSGTSAVTRVLNLLGVELGEPLIGGIESNNRHGFWEHARAVEINNQLLSDLGRSWHDLRPLPSDWMSIQATRDASEHIHSFIRNEFGKSALWGLKDPRLCLLARTWIEAVEEEGFDVLPVIILRHPEEVADSLFARDGLTKSHAYMLWGLYMCSALQALAGRRCAVIDYASFLEHWRSDLTNSVMACGLHVDMNSNDAASEVEKFLDISERHNKRSPVSSEAQLAPLAKAVYGLYEHLANRQGVWSGSLAGIEHLVESFEAAAKMVREPLRELFDHVQIHASKVTSLQSKLAELVNADKAVGVNEERAVFDKVENILAGSVGHLENQFAVLQEEFRFRADKDEERELASEARLQSLDNRIHELAKQTVATELQSATTLAEMSVRVEHQEASLDEVKDTVRRLGIQAEAIRADFVAQFQGLAGSFDQSIGQLQAQVQTQEATLSKRLDGSDANVQELAVAIQQAINQLQGRLDAIGDDFLTHSRNADGFVAITLQRIESIESSQGACLGLVNSANARVVEQFEQFEQRVEAMSAEVNSRLDDLQGALALREAKVQAIGAELATSVARLRDIETSTSWRITAPLRWIRKALMPRTWKAALGRTVKATYDHLPLSAKRRIALKGMVFRALSPVLRNTQSYRAWKAFEAHRGSGPLHGAASNPRDPSSASAGAVSRQEQPAAPVTVTDAAEQQNVTGQVLAELQAAAGRVSNEYVAIDDNPADMSHIDVRAIAFYLPQFHPIPENDKWWGRGFTEWTNVSKAVPQFVGHYQPRLPGELGYYDLRLVDVMRRQVELARHYGLQGFCFHYYWFGGQRLLEKPLQQFLDNKDIDFPFCICWANENWSRRWDGLDQDVLMAQQHSPEDDIAFITALEPLLRDPRYIRVDGRPLIVLYRPSILPDATATQKRWREHCRKVGIGEIFLAMVQFDVEDPRTYGFDVAIEFPPHKLARGLDPINDQLQIVNPEYSGYVIDYGSVIVRARQHAAPGFDMIRGLFPSWDNEARKPGRGYTFANATPDRYREWLELAIDYARQHPVAGERLIFINAWNEWAEGAYLEPDRRYGYAYLDQTRQALLANRPSPAGRIVVVSHDAHPHGAQYLALHMAKCLHEVFHFEVDLVLLGEGELKPEFACHATVHDLTGKASDGEDASRLARQLYASGARHAIANTTVSGLFAKALKQAGFRVISLVHELPGVIRDNQLEEHARALVQSSGHVVFPAQQVRSGFDVFAQGSPEQAVIRSQGLYKLNRYAPLRRKAEARQQLRQRLGISATANIVLCVGYADRRKGVDLFVEIGERVIRRHPDTHFVWVGHFDVRMEPSIRDAVAEGGFGDQFHFPGLTRDTDLYYAGADVYALTSREDPFPSVVMESLQVGVPVVGFSGAGGFTALLEEGAGQVVAANDPVAFANAVAGLLADPALAQSLGSRGRALIEERYSFRSYLFDLLDLVGLRHPRVSVVVPNYNYARHLVARLGSIIDQQVPFYELIVLDDASTDDSLEILEVIGIERGVHMRTLANSDNSGSVFRQWARGVQMARGEFVWIAEADDLSEPGFLSTLTMAASDPGVVMAYCESRQIDGNGVQIAEDYREYTNDVSPGRWKQGYRVAGTDEIRDCFGVKNTIPNVSAVLFRRSALLSALERDLDLMCSFRIAGDWVAYLAVLEQGDVVYVPEALNLHRRHDSSVTLGSNRVAHMREILRVQQIVADRYQPEPLVIEKAKHYASQVCQYLGLSSQEFGALLHELG